MSSAPLPQLLPLNLEAIDGVEVDSLALGLFADERPLRGVTGLVDWRMCGLLSRYLRCGRFSGRIAERVLMPGAGRIGPTRIFVFGMGARDELADVLPGLEQAIPDVLTAAGCRRAALALPGPAKVVAPSVERIAQRLGSKLVAIFDADGRLRDWLDRETG
ncbi:MAG: hypothetical protein JXR83_14705 [Deltaproteobacteria bacterium]|nr:hypothetical protein [Deltaproteobacteria bacterium]